MGPPGAPAPEGAHWDRVNSPTTNTATWLLGAGCKTPRDGESPKGNGGVPLRLPRFCAGGAESATSSQDCEKVMASDIPPIVGGMCHLN